MEALVLFGCTPVSIPLGSKIRCRPVSDSSAVRLEQVRAPASARPTQYPPRSASNPSPSQTRTAARDSQVPSRPDSLELALQENREARSRTVLWLLINGAVAAIALIVSIVSFISAGAGDRCLVWWGPVIFCGINTIRLTVKMSRLRSHKETLLALRSSDAVGYSPRF